MAKVLMTLVAGGFRAEKWFQWSERPLEGEEVYVKLRANGGYAIVKIRWVKHYASEDFYEAICDDALDALCRLYTAENIDGAIDEDNGKWKMENFAEFELDSEVVKAIAKINVYKKKIAQ